MAFLSEIFRYPVKSTQAESLSACAVTSLGLSWDRSFMLADAQGRMVTGRTDPRLVMVHACIEDQTLSLTMPDLPPLSLPLSCFDRPAPASVWKDDFSAYAGSAEADACLSAFLGRPVHLLYIGAEPARRMRTHPEQSLSFADGYPLLLIGQASLDELNRRIGRVFPMRSFRPNLVITGSEAFAEDGWKRIRIGEVILRVDKPCERCVFTTVDPDSGQKSPDQEPLRTLAAFRKTAAGVLFGQNLLVEQGGQLSCGMALEVLE